MEAQQILAYKCPHCGAPLTFDAEKQLFDCEYCQSEFSEATLQEWEARRNQKLTDAAPPAAAAATAPADDDTAVYNCPNCGAEIITEPTTAATFCYYCHSPVVLAGRLDKSLRPDKVLPFSVSREQAIEKFLTWTKSKKYVPKAFFSPEQIAKISGVYYPYWLADYQGHAHFVGEGVKSSSYVAGNFQVTEDQYFQVDREAEVVYHDVARPALSAADRKLAEGVHPYDMSQARDFSPAYLSGFFAEKRDVEAAAVQPDIEQELQGYTEDMLANAAGYDRLNGNTTVDYASKNYKYCLLPAWVLTYQGGDDKNYYYAMNGCSGRTCGILPLDKGRLLRHCAVMGGIVAVILGIVGWLI